MVNDIISKSDKCTHFKQHIKPRKYSPLYLYSRYELFQLDKIFFRNKDMVEANTGFRYMLTKIDVFTKMVWIYPLKVNNCQNIIACLYVVTSQNN